MRKTTEQWRAKAAWEQVEKYPQKIDDFSTTTDGASALIQKVGLGQALAFWLAKSDKVHNAKIADYLAQWLLREPGSFILNDLARGRDLMKHITDINSLKYRVLTNEALAYLFWLKRFSKAKKKG
ncbi:MAG: type III-B CRISPR module-associated protein Cmr5 [Balneolales bacterium]|nr:type III-B CRISPR module-associated protein Cmr5 [Balneolales bacterium]